MHDAYLRPVWWRQSYNGIGLWFVEGVAGIRVHFSEEYHLTIRAGVDAGDITDAQGKRAALHGIATSAWTVTARGFDHKVTVPGNGVAKVLIPSNNGAAGVNEGAHGALGASTHISNMGPDLTHITLSGIKLKPYFIPASIPQPDI